MTAIILQNLDNDLSEAQSEVASLRKGAEESQKLLATRDEMLLDLKDKLRYTEENYNDMKGILSAKNNELGRAQYDIAAISRESQMVGQTLCLSHINLFLVHLKSLCQIVVARSISAYDRASKFKNKSK